jgi:hypothetical protein
MSKSQRVRRIVEYRFPGWLAAVAILILVLAIKFATG